MTTTDAVPQGEEYFSKLWRRLDLLAQVRQASNANEQAQIKNRTEIRGRLDRLGPGSSMNHLQTSREFVVCIFAIDYERARQKTLADKMQEVIVAGRNHTFWDESEVDGRIPTESDLFTAAAEAEAKKAAAKPVGIAAAPEATDEGDAGPGEAPAPAPAPDAPGTAESAPAAPDAPAPAPAEPPDPDKALAPGAMANARIDGEELLASLSYPGRFNLTTFGLPTVQTFVEAADAAELEQRILQAIGGPWSRIDRTGTRMIIWVGSHRVLSMTPEAKGATPPPFDAKDDAERPSARTIPLASETPNGLKPGEKIDVNTGEVRKPRKRRTA